MDLSQSISQWGGGKEEGVALPPAFCGNFCILKAGKPCGVEGGSVFHSLYTLPLQSMAFEKEREERRDSTEN